MKSTPLTKAINYALISIVEKPSQFVKRQVVKLYAIDLSRVRQEE
jgi:uncharacterized protein YggT (Ycf19 family)